MATRFLPYGNHQAAIGLIRQAGIRLLERYKLCDTNAKMVMTPLIRHFPDGSWLRAYRVGSEYRVEAFVPEKVVPEKVRKQRKIVPDAFFISSRATSDVFEFVFADGDVLNPLWPDTVPPPVLASFPLASRSGVSFRGRGPVERGADVFRTHDFTDGAMVTGEFVLEFDLTYAGGAFTEIIFALQSIPWSSDSSLSFGYQCLNQQVRFRTNYVVPGGGAFTTTFESSWASTLRTRIQVVGGLFSLWCNGSFVVGTHHTGGTILSDGIVLLGSSTGVAIDMAALGTASKNLRAIVSDIAFDAADAVIALTPVAKTDSGSSGGWRFTPAPPGWIHFPNYPPPPTVIEEV